MNFGDWRYDARRLVLIFEPAGYEIDLESMTTPAAVLHWVAQVRRKTWSTPAVVGYLVRAVDELLGLQQNLCPGGEAAACDPREILRSRRR